MDVVFCPSLTTKPLLVFTKKDINGVFISFRLEEYWFTDSGVGVGTPINKKSLPLLFSATEDNQKALGTLYDMDFTLDNRVVVYAVNILHHGSGTDKWLGYTYKDYYHPVEVSEGFKGVIEAKGDSNICLSPMIKDLKDAESSHIDAKIICVGNDDIWNWANKDKYGMVRTKIEN